VIVPRPFPAILDGVRPRDAIDLMTWSCFSLAKRPRYAPMVREYRGDFVRVTPSRGSPGLATIWDADILIWAVSQFAEAGNRRLAISPVLMAPAFQVLRFLGRPTGQSQYALLKAGLDRLAGAEVETSVAVPKSRAARFRWVEHWEQTDGGFLLVFPEWLYAVVVERRRILRIDPGYFRLTGGTERWLWRLLRRHGQGKSTAWEIPLSALQARSGSLARSSDFIGDLRRIAHRRVLLGYALALVSGRGQERLRVARSADLAHSSGRVPGDKPRGFVHRSGAVLVNPFSTMGAAPPRFGRKSSAEQAHRRRLNYCKCGKIPHRLDSLTLKNQTRVSSVVGSLHLPRARLP
jgi:plasmid replication initiation protein